jgi:endogenous inhibitor of DNA gyrase (YacG/DUF329 family)
MLAGMHPCPICDRPAAPRKDNPAFPFCSPRCRTVDLGKWLNEEYRVPVEHEETDEVAGPSTHAGHLHLEEKA